MPGVTSPPSLSKYHRVDSSQRDSEVQEPTMVSFKLNEQQQALRTSFASRHHEPVGRENIVHPRFYGSLTPGSTVNAAVRPQRPTKPTAAAVVVESVLQRQLADTQGEVETIRRSHKTHSKLSTQLQRVQIAQARLQLECLRDLQNKQAVLDRAVATGIGRQQSATGIASGLQDVDLADSMESVRAGMATLATDVRDIAVRLNAQSTCNMTYTAPPFDEYLNGSLSARLYARPAPRLKVPQDVDRLDLSDAEATLDRVQACRRALDLNLERMVGIESDSNPHAYSASTVTYPKISELDPARIKIQVSDMIAELAQDDEPLSGPPRTALSQQRSRGTPAAAIGVRSIPRKSPVKRAPSSPPRTSTQPPLRRQQRDRQPRAVEEPPRTSRRQPPTPRVLPVPAMAPRWGTQTAPSGPQPTSPPQVTLPVVSIQAARSPSSAGTEQRRQKTPAQVSYYPPALTADQRPSAKRPSANTWQQPANTPMGTDPEAPRAPVSPAAPITPATSAAQNITTTSATPAFESAQALESVQLGPQVQPVSAAESVVGDSELDDSTWLPGTAILDMPQIEVEQASVRLEPNGVVLSPPMGSQNYVQKGRAPSATAQTQADLHQRASEWLEDVLVGRLMARPAERAWDFVARTEQRADTLGSPDSAVNLVESEDRVNLLVDQAFADIIREQVASQARPTEAIVDKEASSEPQSVIAEDDEIPPATADAETNTSACHDIVQETTTAAVGTSPLHNRVMASQTSPSLARSPSPEVPIATTVGGTQTSPSSAGIATVAAQTSPTVFQGDVSPPTLVYPGPNSNVRILPGPPTNGAAWLTDRATSPMTPESASQPSPTSAVAETKTSQVTRGTSPVVDWVSQTLLDSPVNADGNRRSIGLSPFPDAAEVERHDRSIMVMTPVIENLGNDGSVHPSQGSIAAGDIDTEIQNAELREGTEVRAATASSLNESAVMRYGVSVLSSVDASISEGEIVLSSDGEWFPPRDFHDHPIGCGMPELGFSERQMKGLARRSDNCPNRSTTGSETGEELSEGQLPEEPGKNPSCDLSDGEVHPASTISGRGRRGYARVRVLPGLSTSEASESDSQSEPGVFPSDMTRRIIGRQK